MRIVALASCLVACSERPPLEGDYAGECTASGVLYRFEVEGIALAENATYSEPGDWDIYNGRALVYDIAEEPLHARADLPYCTGECANQGVDKPQGTVIVSMVWDYDFMPLLVLEGTEHEGTWNGTCWRVIDGQAAGHGTFGMWSVEGVPD